MSKSSQMAQKEDGCPLRKSFSDISKPVRRVGSRNRDRSPGTEILSLELEPEPEQTDFSRSRIGARAGNFPGSGVGDVAVQNLPDGKDFEPEPLEPGNFCWSRSHTVVKYDPKCGRYSKYDTILNTNRSSLSFFQCPWLPKT